jgi:glucose-1-phosphate cytidylyltransferase
MRSYPGQAPKPMVKINGRPILWHLMKYYAHFGHKDFILCLGYKGNIIKSYFRNYDECVTNDFMLSEGGERLDLYSSDIHDWRITFANTGLRSNIGQRLVAVRRYVEGEEMFLANYSDGLSDLPLPKLINFFKESNKIACFVSVKLNFTCHFVTAAEDNFVTDIKGVHDTNLRINGGFFVLKQEIFNYIKDGEELVYEPFQRLIKERQLVAFKYDGFFKCMDTFAEKREFDQLVASCSTPWQIWNTSD